MEAKAHRANRHVKDLSRIRCLREPAATIENTWCALAVGVFIIQSKEDVVSSQFYLLESGGVELTFEKTLLPALFLQDINGEQ